MRKPDEAHQKTDKQLAALEKRIAAEYQKAAKELQDKIDDYFEKFRARDAEQKALIGTIVNGKEYTNQDYQQWRLAQIGRGERFEALRDRVAQRMTSANEVAAAYINDATPGIYSLNRNYAAYTIEQQVGAGIGFDLWDEQTVRRLIVERPDLMPFYPPERAVRRGFDLAYGKRQITAQVTSGILQGESIKHIADRLQTKIPDMNRTSAIRAARTAVTGAQNAGRLDSYYRAEEMGISLEKQWLATLDSRTRHDHAAADGQTVEEDKPFIVGGYELMYPGDPSGPAHEVYNCRCTMIAKVRGVDMSDAQRRARDPETGESVVIENMTYAEWAEWKNNMQSVPDDLMKNILGTSHPMSRYTREDGTFDLKSAKSDYEKFLKNVPEKNKIYLQQALDAVEYQQTSHQIVVFGYSQDLDMIFFNPEHPAFAEYDFFAVNTHELGHRIDCMFVESWGVVRFQEAIQNGKQIILDHSEEFVLFCLEHDEDGFLSDILSAICEDEIRFPAWHEAEYWAKNGNRQREIFANFFSLETYQDEEKIKFLQKFFPDLVAEYNALNFEIR